MSATCHQHVPHSEWWRTFPFMKHLPALDLFIAFSTVAPAAAPVPALDKLIAHLTMGFADFLNASATNWEKTGP